MSPSDLTFLKALGIAAEEIEPAGAQVIQFGGGVWSYERCPECDGKRHRFIADGTVFCLSCANRKQREKRYEQALARANHRPSAWEEYRGEATDGVEIYYQGAYIAWFDGLGWVYRIPGGALLGWRKASSYLDAELRVDRLVGPQSQEIDEERVENRCRGCDEPCGPRRWCTSCGRQKFGY